MLHLTAVDEVPVDEMPVGEMTWYTFISKHYEKSNLNMKDEMVDILKEKKCCKNNLIGIFLKYFKIILMHENY